MIIKIAVDDGIDRSDAGYVVNELLNQDFLSTNSEAFEYDANLRASITHISKAGNIFIHVSKVE